MGRVGYHYIRIEVDDRIRIARSEIVGDEEAVTEAGFRSQAAGPYRTRGVECQRVITDNGSCDRSGCWRRACAAIGSEGEADPTPPAQTNGKAERFRRILFEDWAYIRPRISETERTEAFAGSIQFRNHHPGHGAPGRTTLNSLNEFDVSDKQTNRCWNSLAQ